MAILRLTVLAAMLTLFAAVSLSYAAPSCCDPNSNQGAMNNSFLPRPPSGQYAPLGPAPSGNVNPGFRRASVASGAIKRGSPQQAGCCGGTGPGFPTSPASAPSCCSGANRPGPAQARAYFGPGQPPAGGCGGGCSSGGTVAGAFPGYQTARPIGQFVGAPPRGAKATPVANQGFYMQQVRPYSGQGFERPGYFGQANPVSNTLY